MSRRQTITYTCDECGRQSSHDMLELSHLHNGIFTTNPYPSDWTSVPVIGTTQHKDVCHACKPKPPQSKKRKSSDLPTDNKHSNKTSPVQTGTAPQAAEYEEPHCPV